MNRHIDIYIYIVYIDISAGKVMIVLIEIIATIKSCNVKRVFKFKIVYSMALNKFDFLEFNFRSNQTQTQTQTPNQVQCPPVLPF